VITTGKKKTTSETKSAARPKLAKVATEPQPGSQETVETPDEKKPETNINDDVTPVNSDYSYF
jgi:hypothetical protein